MVLLNHLYVNSRDVKKKRTYGAFHMKSESTGCHEDNGVSRITSNNTGYQILERH